MIKASYFLLGLISYFTAGKQEVRAWTIKRGTKAPQAAGKIHSDFERGFIRAEVVSFNDLIFCGSVAAAKEKGFRIKVWDAFRPVSAQRRFWDLFPNNDFVARPPDVNNMTEFKNSHMNGQCVDVTLTDLNGNEVPMPSEFDDFTEKARLDCKETTGEARKNAEFLRDIMAAAGFTPYSGEWWHFYDRNVKPVKYSESIPD